MKKILFVLGLVFTFTLVQAQNFEKGDMGLNLGIGLGDAHYSGLVPIPSANASFEVGIVDIPNVGVIGVGGFAGFANSWHNWGGIYRDTYTTLILSSRGVFHFGFFDTGNFDLYAGLHLGYGHTAVNYDDDYYAADYDYVNTYMVYDAFAGARWMKNDKFGFFAELGYGISFLKAGVTFKF